MLPSSPVSWALLLVAFTPGWCAVRGWFYGRSAAAPDLSQWWPAASALGFAWTGAGALTCRELVVAATTSDLALPVAVLGWLGMAFALWLLPFWLGWVAGRLWPTSAHRRGDLVTVVFKDGSAAHGVYRRTSGDRVTLGDGSGGDYAGSAVEIARDEIRMIVRDPSQRGVAASARLAEASASEGSDGAVVTAADVPRHMETDGQDGALQDEESLV